jgi:hypothetical protein
MENVVSPTMVVCVLNMYRSLQSNNNLHSIYTVLGIISNLETYSIQENVCRLYANTTVLYKGPEPPPSLVSVEFPTTNSL